MRVRESHGNVWAEECLPRDLAVGLWVRVMNGLWFVRDGGGRVEDCGWLVEVWGNKREKKDERGGGGFVV